MNILPTYQYLLSVCRTSLFAGGFDPKKGSEVWARTADELSPCAPYFDTTHRTKKKVSEQTMADWMILHL